MHKSPTDKPKLFRITTVPISIEKLLGSQLTFMSEHFHVTAIASDDEVLSEVAKKLGVKHHAVQMSRKITPITDLKSLIKMYRYFKKEKPDIVHTHTPKAGVVGMLAAKLAGVPIRLHTVAGLPLMEATGTKRKILDAVERLTYNCATKVYPNSKGLQDFIIKEKLTSPEKLNVIGNGSSNGINTVFFDVNQISKDQIIKLKTNYGIKESDFVYVFVGRLVADKGINELVKAFANLKIPNVKLLLVGSQEPDLDPLAPITLSEIANNPTIISTGYQSDVRPYFAISNALTFPSYREGFPNVVLQAAAMDLPAIVSNINGCNEIIDNGVNGIIVSVKNSEELEKAMIDLNQDSIKYDLYKSNARIMVKARYEQSVVWSEILKEYRGLLHNL